MGTYLDQTCEDMKKDSDSGGESSQNEESAEEQRRRNIREREEYFKKCALEDPEFAEALEYINSGNKENITTYNEKPPRANIKRQTKSVYIPMEQRKSSRLRNSQPEYDLTYLDQSESWSWKNITNYYKYRDDDDDDSDYLTKKLRNQKRRKISFRPQIIQVEDVTNAMLNNIVRRVKDKLYDSSGTSCHQCRQKTADQKTCCRNPECVGVQGQFCGVCIINRYGEDVEVALLDPNWKCFVCRGMCNCSFCRRKEGKRPTGILAPIAQKMGHSNVSSFLNSLEGVDDFIDDSDEDYLPIKKRRLRSSMYTLNSDTPNFNNHHSKEELPNDDNKVFLGFDLELEESKRTLGMLIGFKNGVPHFDPSIRECPCCPVRSFFNF